jgi:ADP-ribose pyrophosphatase YjhB (NUDIX family)
MNIGKQPEFTIGCFTIVIKNGKVLLIQREDNGKWAIPGGGLQYGEWPQHCAAREIYEETGFKVKVQKLTGVYVKRKANNIVLAFRGEIIGGRQKLSDETLAVGFFPLDKLPSSLIPTHRQRIEDAINPTGPAIRMQKTMNFKPFNKRKK